MTHRDLETLKTVAADPPRAEAKRAAIDTALSAFDAATFRPQEKIGFTTKENTRAGRPTRTSNRTRSFFMGYASRQNMAIAASLAALVIVAPLAFKTYEWDQRISEPSQLPPSKPEIDLKRMSSEANALPPPPPLPDAKKQDGTLADAQPSAPRNDNRPAPSISKMVQTLPSDNSLDALAALTRKAEKAPRSRAFAEFAPSYLTGQSFDQADGRAAQSVAGLVEDEPAATSKYKDRDVFEATKINPVKQTATDPVSTFSVDVDTASYSFVRRALNSGHLPPKDAVRVEEMINYFPYDYPAPSTPDIPFKPTVTVVPAPWKPTDLLVHIAIKGYDLKRAERPRANLVFLLDVSGSMESDDRLPLVKNALRMFVDQLRPDDTVGIVTYASGSGIALEPTKIGDKQKILAAIDKLDAGGSTDGADGIEDAYRLAEANFDKDAVNRIILATDGDFNVGITDRDQLKGLIERKRATGIYLSILGVGQGNHNDALMQALAQNGNGTAAYVDTLNEARKILVDEASSTLFPIAKDVKAQVEWNPARVSEYRLIGYETRALSREDFNNDQVDAGDIGSGHTVTAIYEITPVGSPRLVDDLRYGKLAGAGHESEARDEESEFGFLKLRYKKPGSDTSDLVSLPITPVLAKPTIADVPQDVRFSVAVAAFGDLLRGAPYEAKYSFDDVMTLAKSARGDDPFGYRAEFVTLARLAKSARP
ncbi:MAG: VWA domain-containing protein [Hyphomicrobium sp.]|uniref:vWA domain-containing protein n=1 Tax=Hyphomicrobium sp. TaxID=82 RepID=UPI0039E3E27F